MYPIVSTAHKLMSQSAELTEKTDDDDSQIPDPEAPGSIYKGDENSQPNHQRNDCSRKIRNIDIIIILKIVGSARASPQPIHSIHAALPLVVMSRTSPKQLPLSE